MKLFIFENSFKKKHWLCPLLSGKSICVLVSFKWNRFEEGCDPYFSLTAIILADV